MRFRLEASPGELEQKGDSFIKALADEVRFLAPDLAERLEKALPPREQALKYPALRQLADKTAEEYARTLERIVEEVGKVLDRSTKPDARYIEKSDSADDLFEKAMAGPFIGPRGGKWADAAHTVAWHPGLGTPQQITAAGVGKRSSEVPAPKWAEERGPWKSEAYSFPEGTEAHPIKTVSLSQLPDDWGAGGSYDIRDNLKKILGEVKAPEGYEIVYRVASGPTGLAKKNAGNLEAVTDFIMDMEEKGVQYGDKITAYAVKLPKEFASYKELRAQRFRGEAIQKPEPGKVDTATLLEGNFGIPRIDMPQIKSTLVPEFIEGLRKKGVNVERGSIRVSNLKATQSEIHEEKVQALIDDPKAHESLKKPVMVSKDGYILDGHHRWAALRTLDPDDYMGAVKIGLPIKELLAEAKGFHAVEFKKAEEEPEDFYDYTFDVFDRDDRAYNRVKAVLKQKGFFDTDFEEDGPLYGWSVNQLIELAQGDLQKAGGPFIGPRGGKWADPEHTQSWQPGEIKTALEAAIEHHGGKVRPHENDPTKMVVKIPVAHAEALAALKQKYHLADEIKLGEKYAVLPVPKVIFHGVQKKAPPKKTPEDKPAQSGTMGDKKSLVPPYSKSEWKPHKTVEEAKTWAKEQGIDVAYSDLATANQLNHAISEQHPWIKKHVEFLGTASQLHTWAEEHPDINKRAMTEAKHTADLRQFSLGGSAIAVAHPTTGKPYSQSVVVLTDSWGTAEKYDSHKNHLSSGFTVGSELADTVRHEFGHVEGFIFRHLYPQGKDGPSAWEVWKKHCVAQLKTAKGGVMKDISQYGATNPHECWAEVSVMRRRGMPLPAWVHAAVEEMKIDSVPWDDMGKIWSTP